MFVFNSDTNFTYSFNVDILTWGDAVRTAV